MLSSAYCLVEALELPRDLDRSCVWTMGSLATALALARERPMSARIWLVASERLTTESRGLFGLTTSVDELELEAEPVPVEVGVEMLARGDGIKGRDCRRSRVNRRAAVGGDSPTEDTIAAAVVRASGGGPRDVDEEDAVARGEVGESTLGTPAALVGPSSGATLTLSFEVDAEAEAVSVVSTFVALLFFLSFFTFGGGFDSTLDLEMRGK